jgi:hypothetical protein
VHRQIVPGAFARRLATRRIGAPGRGYDRDPRRGRCIAPVIVKQDRSKRGAHVPFEVVGEHAEQHVRPHPIGQAMMDRANLEIDSFE